MQTKSIYKVPNGKLIKIFLDYNSESNTIASIQISGDFFAYPEESIHQLEEQLKGKQLEKNGLYDLINSFVQKNKVEFIGINPESLTEAVMRCQL
jgi:lipoate---protein ligase